MADLICTCNSSDELVLHTIPDDCGAVDFGYPYILLIQNKTATNTFAGTVPTVAELEAMMLDTDEGHLIAVGPVTNGKKSEKTRQSETGADTIDGLETVYSQTIALEGKLKYLNETVIADLAKLNCYTRVRMWFVTNKGYLFGGATGYIVPNFFSEFLHDGFGGTSYVPIAFEYVVDRKHDFSDTAQDDDYLTLQN